MGSTHETSLGMSCRLGQKTNSQTWTKVLQRYLCVLMFMNPGRVCEAREKSGLKIGITRCLMSDPEEYGNRGGCEFIKEPLIIVWGKGTWKG